jgi:hypothetical protein
MVVVGTDLKANELLYLDHGEVNCNGWGFAPSFSAHVPDFLPRGPTNIRVCGFH